MTSLHGELECLVRSGRILLNGDAVRTPKKLKSRCSVWRGMLMMVTEDNAPPRTSRSWDAHARLVVCPYLLMAVTLYGRIFEKDPEYNR